MKSYYITTQTDQKENHELHRVGCSHLPLERRYIGEFKNLEEALLHIKYTHKEAINCRHCSGV